jgi:hypothetical protein
VSGQESVSRSGWEREKVRVVVAVSPEGSLTAGNAVAPGRAAAGAVAESEPAARTATIAPTKGLAAGPMLLIAAG